MAGGRIDILVAPDTRDFVGKMRRDLKPAIGAATALGGALGLAFAGTAAIGQVISIGNDFTSTLNTMKAVAGATADQMSQVSARAKELGNDITLPGTSANNAAAAMTELAKGGFTVQQSMDAAKGSLQLAAAAQIDAAEAATIQSSALQAFGLQADQAGRVADVLANTANASSAEITDVAYALQSGAAVAHQFGLSVEDTAAAIGLFANSGIKGSDAGTLLKSALLALTDQGKPARESMHALGLEAYDSQGKFVGLHSLFEQLSDASKRMTDQEYQAATATLFGSDAARLAGIAAEKGAEGFDKMQSAMSRQGSAADVANAKMQGLPGAMQQIQNAAENMALEVYELAKGPLESFAKGAAGAIDDATPRLVSGLHAAADGAADVGHALAPVVKFVADLPTPILAATAALVAFRTTAIGPAMSKQIGTARQALTGFGDQMKLQQSLAAASGTSLSRYGAAVATLEARVQPLGRMSEAYRTASDSATRLARTQGTVAAASSGLKSAASGVVGLLGGPWVLALTAATAAVTSFIAENARAEAREKAMQDLAKEGAKLRVQQAEIFASNNGAFDTKAIDAATRQVEILKTSMDQLSENRSGFWDRAFEAPWSDDTHDQDWQADRWTGAKKIMDDLKISDQQLAETLADTSKFNDLNAKLQGMGQDGRYAASALQGARDELLKTQQTAQNTSPGFATLSAAVKTLADESSTAADRIDAMKTALQVLSGKPVAVQDALSQYNQQVRATADATSQLWDTTAGFGQQLVGTGGQVDTATANGQRLYESLTRIRDATITAAEAGADMGPVLSKNDTQFAQLANSAGLSVEQVRTMAQQLGYLPKDIEILASLKGADSVEQQLTVVEGLLRNNAQGVDIPVSALTEDAKKELEATGVKIDEVNGKPGIVHVSAPDLATVLSKLQELIDKKLPDKTQKVNVTYEQATASGEWRAPMVFPEDRPRADGGIDGPLPSQATIQSPRAALYQWAEPETGGEAFIPMASSKRARSTEILGTVAASFGYGLTKMADGGIAVNRALDFLRGENGKNYQYGGVGNPSWDCSAILSAAYALLKGLNPYVRYFTTESNFPELGFISGLDPSGRGLSLGIFRGGGGQYSHMAGKLNGTGIESNSSGVHVGAGATDPGDSQFGVRFYLPVSAFDPPGEGGGSGRSSRRKQETWDESDDLDLQSAVISRDQANQARDEKLADPDVDPNEKKQAQIQARQAQIRVDDLEKKRDQAKSSGGPVPEAPPLQGDLTDDQIRLQELHQAVIDAKTDRDYVYADPESTDADRHKSDLDYQKAINAERAEQKKQRESGADGSGDAWTNSVVGLLGDAAKTAVTGAAGELLTAVGLGGDIGGVTGAFIGIAADQVKKATDKDKSAPPPASPSESEVNRQGPVTPGTYNWLPQLLKTFQLPMVLRDMGGPVPHGVAALNLSGRDEYMLSPDEYAAARTMSATRQPAAPTQNIDGSVIIQNLHTGMTQAEFRREWRIVQTEQRDRLIGLGRRG